jgi:hypothetical protein
MKFSIRDLLLVTVIVALTVGWWIDRRHLAQSNLQLGKRNERLREDEKRQELELALSWATNLYSRYDSADGKVTMPPKVTRGEGKIVLEDLDLALLKVTLDPGVGDSSVLFFSETEITNRMYAAFLADTQRMRDDSAVVKAQEELSGEGYSSTVSPVIEVHNPASLWKDGRYPEGRGEHPVSFLTIPQAADFCDWLTHRYSLGGKLRLPTDKEWLFAAYGRSRKFPWGDEKRECTSKSTEPVKSRPELKTPEGLYGLWGNVSELVLSSSDGYGGKIEDKYSPWITQWLGESYEASDVRGKPPQARQDYWGYTHSLQSRSDQWGFRVVFVPGQ